MSGAGSMSRRSVGSVIVLALLTAVTTAPAAAQDCNRLCLEGWVDRYLDAVIDNDPSSLPMTRDVRFTENGVQLEIGDGGTQPAETLVDRGAIAERQR